MRDQSNVLLRGMNSIQETVHLLDIYKLLSRPAGLGLGWEGATHRMNKTGLMKKVFALYQNIHENFGKGPIL